MVKDHKIIDAEKINPLGWGILLFTFWGLALTEASLKQQPLACIIGWISFAVSMLMLAAIIPSVRKWLSRPRIKKWIIVAVFYITIMGNFIAFGLIITGIDPSLRLMADIFVLIWSTVYMVIFASKIPLWTGVIGSVIVIIAGVQTIIGAVTIFDKWMIGILYSVLAILIFVCSLKKFPCLADLPTI